MAMRTKGAYIIKSAKLTRFKRTTSGNPCRVAVVSDTHGHLDPRISEVVTGCDAAIHAGDIGGAQMLSALQPTQGLVYAVVGNNDTESKWSQCEQPALKELPEVFNINVEGLGNIAVEHGHRVRNTKRYHEELRARHSDSKIIVYGHTHIRVIDKTQSPWVINPGAAGKERTGGGPSCLVVEVSDSGIQVEEHVFPLHDG